MSTRLHDFQAKVRRHLSQFKPEYAVASLPAGTDRVCLSGRVHELDGGHARDQSPHIEVRKALLGLAERITSVSADIVSIVTLFAHIKAGITTAGQGF